MTMPVESRNTMPSCGSMNPSPVFPRGNVENDERALSPVVYQLRRDHSEHGLGQETLPFRVVGYSGYFWFPVS